jgi:hypothetical protein
MISEPDKSNQLSNSNLYSFKSNLENKTLIFIYQITCNDPNITENYIGQTVCFDSRKSQHERDSKFSDLKIYETIRKYGGWNNWNMKIMNHYYCKDEHEARQIEQKYIDIFKANMNRVRAYSKSFMNEQIDRELEFELLDYSDRIFGCFLYDFYLDIDFDNQNKMICEFCNTNFNTISSLNNHKKKAKYCLIIQGKMEGKDKNFECECCKKVLSSKQNLKIHLKKCGILEEEKQFNCQYCKKVLSTKQNLLYHMDTCDKKLKYEIENYKKQLEKQEENYKKQLEKQLEKQKEIYIKQLEKQEEQIKDLQNKLDKIANKAIDRPTTTNHNTVNNKFELNTFPSQREIDRKIESQFNDKYILDGMKGIAQFVFDHIVKLEDGSMAYACYDTSRQMFKYKDENGNEIKDPKAVKLKKMIKPGLLKQSKTLLDYFNDECDYLEKRKDNGQDIDGKEYNIMNTLREKAFEVGCEILSIEDTNKFTNELANLSCV